MKLIAALVISHATLLAQADNSPLRTVTAVRTWLLADVTRLAIEVSGGFQFRSDRLNNPDRVYFDILNSLPRIDSKRFYSKELNDKLVKRIRVAETNPGVTRVVLDLGEGVEVGTSQLSNPSRLIIEVRSGKGLITPPETVKVAPPPPLANPPVKAPERHEVAVAGTSAPTALKPATKHAAALDSPARREAPPTKEALPEPNEVTGGKPEPRQPAVTLPPPLAKPSIKREVAEADVPKPTAPRTPESTKLPGVKSEAALPSPPVPGELGTAAKHTSSGESSLTRALGLKVGRVVIDPGHGGHDQGTLGPKGLVEKDLVLDVALRVGKLIEDHLSSEVIYTRTDDTFIPLEGRTALANEKKADLFLSIHANSSPYPRISGVETFYLNFTDSKDAMDVASRENASSQKSVFELQDIIQKISLHEKLDESKEFARRIQASLFSLSSHNVPGQKNRGVKKAPFVVLIGANMPSVLAEIGFISNAREEALLKKPEYRQKVAEALYRGLSKYADSLSHFQMAQSELRDGHE